MDLTEAIQKSIAEVESADAMTAYTAATELMRLAATLSEQARDLRSWAVTRMHYEDGIEQAVLAKRLGLSSGRVGQLVRTGRKKHDITVSRKG